MYFIIMKDSFVFQPPLQPKREICDYLEAEGIRVPARIANLKDAIKEGHRFIIRGEHPQDYNGASDLLESMIVDPQKHFEGEGGLQSEQEVIDKVTDDCSHAAYCNLQRNLPILTQQTSEMLLAGLRRNTVGRYCELMQIPKDDYLAQVSFSYWQYIEGCNHTLLADSAIANRYHLFSWLFKTNRTIASYIIADTGQLEEQAYPSERNAVVAARAPRLIALYEKVRSLPKFDSQHCPILEIQTTDDEQDFVLQVHRTRDFEPAALDLGGVKKEESYFSRGASKSKDGSVYDISILSGYKEKSLPTEPQLNAGAYHFTYDIAFQELMFKRAGVHFMNAKVKDDPYEASKLAAKHCNRSALFKPPVSVQVPVTDIFTEEEISKMMKNPTMSIPVKVMSDGKRAKVNRI